MDFVAARTVPKLGFLSQGLRPFFLAAGFWAAAGLAVWIVMLDTGMSLPSRFDPLSWHIHAMLFGFVMAAIAGFLLTAIPGWTGRPPLTGAPLGALAGLWLLGRITCLISQWLPAWLAVASDMAFPIALAALVAWEIVAARDRRNMPIILAVVILGIANLLMHLEAVGAAIPVGLGWRLGLAAILVLTSVIGGRIIPAFTGNWLARRRITKLPASHGVVDRLALGTLHAGLFGWAALPRVAPLGALLILAAVLNLWRLARWRGALTVTEPLLLILHIGYGWLALGVGLLGASMLTALVPVSAGIHAMAAGAAGTMILAVMTRASRGHTGHPLTADRITSLLYGCVILAVILRIASTFAGDWATRLLTVSAGLWIAAFVLFVARYSSMLLRHEARLQESP